MYTNSSFFIFFHRDFHPLEAACDQGSAIMYVYEIQKKICVWLIGREVTFTLFLFVVKSYTLTLGCCCSSVVERCFYHSFFIRLLKVGACPTYVHNTGLSFVSSFTLGFFFHLFLSDQFRASKQY